MITGRLGTLVSLLTAGALLLVPLPAADAATGEADPVPQVAPATPPPTNVRISEVTADSVTVAWDAPTWSDPGALSTCVAAFTEVATGVQRGTASVGRGYLSATLSYLTPDTEYSVVLTCWAGSEQRTRGPLTVRTLTAPAPGSPTDVRVSMVTGTSADLTWTAPDPVPGQLAFTAYEVAYRLVGEPSWTTDPGVPGTQLPLTSLAPEREYEVTVTTVAGATRSEPSTLLRFVTPAGGPGTPMNVTFENLTSSSVTLTWIAPDGPLSGYLVQYRESTSTTWVSLPLDDPSATSATVEGLRPTTTYVVRIFARAAGLLSGWAALKVETLVWTPGVPTDLRVTAVTADSISIEFRAPTSGAPVARYAITPGFVPPTFPVAAGALEAASEARPEAEVAAPTPAGQAGVLLNATITGLIADEAYRIDVQGVTADGVYGPAASVEARTGTLPPSMPLPPSFGPATTSTAEVHWSPTWVQGALPPTGYELQFRAAGTAGWTTRSTVATSLTVDGLAPGTRYEARVRAVNGSQTSPYTQVMIGWTLPEAPVAVRAEDVSQTGAVLVWDDRPSGEAVAHHRVAYRELGAPFWHEVAMGAATRCPLTGLAPGTTYETRVRTWTRYTGSDWSATVELTTLPGTPPPPVDPTERYVRRVYRDLFGREPDRSGVAYWTGLLTTGTPRVAVANSITASDEYRGRLIQSSYREFLGREAEPGGLAFWLEQMRRGRTIDQMEAGFLSSDEYFANAGGRASTWVQHLYLHVLHRSASPTEVAYWVDQQSLHGRFGVSEGFLLSSERLTTVINGFYVDLLGRSIDPSGRQAWVEAIQHGARLEQIIGSIVASEEYMAKV